MDKEAIATHVRALQSNDLALKLAVDLKLAARPEFNSTLAERGPVGRTLRLIGLVGPRAGESEEELVLAAYYDALRVYQIKDTRGIMIDFRSSDPGSPPTPPTSWRSFTARISCAPCWRAGTRAKLAPQIKKLAEEVAEAEAEVTRFRGQSNIFDGGRDKTGLNEQQLAELNGELTKVATVRAETEARAREAREIAARGAGRDAARRAEIAAGAAPGRAARARGTPDRRAVGHPAAGASAHEAAAGRPGRAQQADPYRGRQDRLRPRA